MLKIGDYFRHGGRSDFEVRGSLRHTATIRDGEEHMEIAQLESSAELVLPIDFFPHSENTFGELEE
jgi:hypothetical protein